MIKTLENMSEDEVIKILHDKDIISRIELAKLGCERYLDFLVYDPSYTVRKLVARYGRDKDLDILVHDKDHEVRLEVAKIGRHKDLDILVNDEYAIVRREVAKHGREKDLKILSKDEVTTVRMEVEKILKKEHKSVVVEVPVLKINEPNKNLRILNSSNINLNNIEFKGTYTLDISENDDSDDEAFTFEDIDKIIDTNNPNIGEKINNISINNGDNNQFHQKLSFKNKISNLFNKIIKKGK